MVQLVPVDGRTIVHGIATPPTERVRLRLDSGEVLELRPTGDAWQLYAGEVAGVGTILEVQAVAADGSVIGRLGVEPSPVGVSLATGGGALQPPG